MLNITIEIPTMSVTEVKSASSVPESEYHGTAQTSASDKKQRKPKKYRANGKKWFQNKDAEGEAEEPEPGCLGDCWACGAGLEVGHLSEKIPFTRRRP